MRLAIGTVNRFSPGGRMSDRLELNGSITKHICPPAALLVTKYPRMVKQWWNPGLSRLVDISFRYTSYSGELPVTTFAVACDVRIFRATNVLVSVDLSLYLWKKVGKSWREID
jgi:hypothetical protein